MLVASLFALFLAAGCGDGDGAGVSVGPGVNAEQNNGDLDAGTDGASANANSGTENSGTNMVTPDAGMPGDCADGDLSSCPAQPGAMPSGCDTSGSASVCDYACESGRSDLNGDLGTANGDGCESDCVVSNGGTEICDGLDNDCNGEVDEGFSVGDSCSEGTGLCETLGSVACLPDGTSACDATAGTPQNETCDGFDNDCDGTVDEENPGGGGACDTGLAGACGAGVETCSGGAIVCDEDVQPITEACGGNNTGDGIDNDCDGDVDEGCASCTEGTTQPCYTGTAGTEGTGLCRSGTQTCTGGQFGACVGQTTPAAETCNNSDDDCDGVTDEDFSDKGNSCTVGTGQCASTGVRVCSADGTGTTCNTTAGSPGTETCNGVDDDCDGQVDEGLTRTCGTNQGICSTGTETCSVGSWGSCQGATNAGTEVCNGLDDDCDGTSDEGFGVGSQCSEGQGACLRTGAVVCSGGSTTCNATAGTPGTETCNGIDDDCDGSIDEGLTRSCGTSQGVCTTGSQTCSSGSWGSCQGGTTATTESCNGLDDDCDGSVDEGLGLGGSCSTGRGACLRTGTLVCSGGSTTCSATAGSPGTETCNGVDDDCDGSVDEGLTRSCGTSQGVCSTGTETCSSGSWGSCQGSTTASTELCNSLDDDCDGSTDEGFGIGLGCSSGRGACLRTGNLVCASSGTSSTCDATPGSPTIETCNNIDDDCDGSVDENVTRRCGTDTGACTSGAQTCTSGSFGSCSGVQPVAETCNGIDDDCDGSTDENYVDLGSFCSVGVGACRNTGSKVCSSSGSGTVCSATAGSPVNEVCGDGIDNDCDGFIDELCISRECTSSGQCPDPNLYCCFNETTSRTECTSQTAPDGSQRLCIQ